MDELSASLSETLLNLCRIPSPIGEEKTLCDYVQARLSLSLEADQIKRFHDSLIVTVATSAKESQKPSIVLVGHLDTVRTRHDGSPRIEGNLLYGAGAADMKSGLAVMIELTERIDRNNLPFDLTLIFYEREEGPFDENRLGPILDTYPKLRTLNLAVCLEPSDNEIQLGAMGSIHATLKFMGQSAHSARPWQGDNALYKAAAFLQKLQTHQPWQIALDNHHFKEVMTPTLIRGGRARNVVPDEVMINLNYRFAPGQKPNEAVERLQSVVDDYCAIEITDLAPSARPHANHWLIQHLSKCGVACVRTKQAWTDVARFDSINVPAVNLGPGTAAQAHQPNEWTELNKLVDGYQIFKRFLTTEPSNQRSP